MNHGDITRLREERDLDGLLAGLQSEDLLTNKSLRAAATRALGSLGSRHAVAPLIGLLADPDYDVRLAATRALGDAGDPQGVPALVERLVDGTNAERSWAAEGLGKIGGHQAVHALIELGLRHETPIVREYAAEALGRLQAREAIAELERSLTDPSRAVRTQAAVALIRIRDDRAIEAVRSSWNRTPFLQRVSVRWHLRAHHLELPSDFSF